MRGNLNGVFSFRLLLLDLSHKFLSVLVNNLRVHVKSMYHLYCFLKDCNTPPTPDEIDIASAKRRLDETTETEYLQKLRKSSETIKKAFQDQQARAIVSEIHLAFHRFRLMISQQGPWDQNKFEELLMEWVVACDQPFEETKRPEFIAMMNYTHHTGAPLKIPGCNGIKRHLMKMGNDTIEDIRNIFSVRFIFAHHMTC